MAYLIGTDEAGYGPNLGPLVISASVWEAPDGVRSEDLYERLAGVIADGANRGARGPRARQEKCAGRTRAACATRQHSRPPHGTTVAMADSKVLYQSGKGLRLLERGLWAAFALLDKRPRTCTEVWDLLAPGCATERSAALSCADGPAPLDADGDELSRLGPLVCQGLVAAGVRLVGLQSRAIFPQQFNAEVERCGSKGEALSHWTLDLVARVMTPIGSVPIAVLCDKHGGRNHYLPLLMAHFPDGLIGVRQEGRQQSVYRFGPSARRVEICFQAKAEAHLPTALASMASKYLRELAMRALNAFWCARVPGLAPTAGYPQDAGRFKAQIAAAQRELGIDDSVLWRVK